jgi:predicted enzyme related to lactoylglutathione lyase
MKVTGFFLNITSDNPERLAAFYRDTVGLEPRLDSGPNAFAIGPEATLGIDGHSETHGRAKEPRRILVDLMVEDIAAEQQALEQKGIRFLRSQGVEFWGGVISTFEDPDGNYVQLIQYRPELATPEGEMAATA